MLIDYIEYRYLNLYPLIEPISFKFIIKSLLSTSTITDGGSGSAGRFSIDNLSICTKLNEVMLNISQSSIDSVNRLISHWTSEMTNEMVLANDDRLH